MTCLIGSDAPPAPARLNPSLAATVLVQVVSCAELTGNDTVDSVPAIIEPTYWLGLWGAVEVGSGCPGPVFGPAPRPFAFVTNRRSVPATTAVGYQPVGMKPRTAPVPVSTTSTSLLPAFAT